MDDVQRVRRKPAAEWGEMPRERVTVIPERPVKSDTPSAVRRLLPTPGCCDRSDSDRYIRTAGSCADFLFLLPSMSVCRTLF